MSKERKVPGEGTAACILEVYEAWKKLNDGEEAEFEGETIDPAYIDEFLEHNVQHDPLAITVRSGWHIPGSDAGAEEYNILLGTGGPAVRIIGDLGQFDMPVTAVLQGQDWFTPWENTEVTFEEQEAINWYVEQFYYGD